MNEPLSLRSLIRPQVTDKTGAEILNLRTVLLQHSPPTGETFFWSRYFFSIFHIDP